MTDTRRTPTMGVQDIYQEPPRSYGSDVDDWTSWIRFAGVVMMVLGAFAVVQGLVALLRPTFYLVLGGRGVLVGVSYGAWGWVHLVLGVLVAAAGAGVIAGRLWARVVGIVLAALSVVINLVFVAAYPIWAVIVIALDVAVIFALVTNRRGSPA